VSQNSVDKKRCGWDQEKSTVTGCYSAQQDARLRKRGSKLLLSNKSKGMVLRVDATRINIQGMNEQTLLECFPGNVASGLWQL